MGCRHSSVDSSAPSILPPRFESQAHHLRLYCANCIFVIWVGKWKEQKLKKRPGLAHFLKKPFDLIGWEPWSTGYGRWLMFERSRVWIPAPYTGWWWHFFTLICCKNCIVCLKRPKINKKRAILKKTFNLTKNWRNNIWSIKVGVATSVTRLQDYFSTFGPMTSMKNFPKVYKIHQSRLKILPNSK